ncbi:unnamed protein product [Symbiodinium sp. CCMP2592]|nr:unnamed protein product [Symbiodinium sp. CCMP2592]
MCPGVGTLLLRHLRHPKCKNQSRHLRSVFAFPARRALPISKGGDNQSRKERVKALALSQALIVTSVCGLAVALSKASDAQVPIILDDVFARKATSTLRSRAGSLLQYARWQRATFGENQLFPASEDRLYQYTCYLRAEGAPASRGERFIQSIRFAHSLLQCAGDLSMLSPRVIGYTIAGVEKRPIVKKWPLKVHQLRKLEQLACGEPSALSIFAGFLCVLVHGRLRFSDGQMCFEEPELEKGEAHNILTLRLYGSKTSSLRRATRFRLIPVFAISPGVHGSECWATSYLENRAALGLSASEDEPLMRCPTADGGFSERKLRSSDASVWMREILSDVCTFEELANIATHSCKATCLAWLTKGAATNAMCRRAGYHVGVEGKSELEYAHDAAAPLIFRLANTLEMIKEGYFSPDEPRLQRWHGAEDYDSALALLRNGGEPKRMRAEKVGRLLADSSSDSESSEEPDDDSDSAESELDGQMAEIHAHSETLDSSSQAIFRQRCLAVGLPGEVIDRLELRGWGTFANFAHAPTATPGTAGAEAAVRVVLEAVLGDTHASHDAALRRLHWEAWTLTAADLKRKVDGTDESAPRKLPVAEIGARLQVLTPKIAPLKLEGILEPSHASINLFAAMLDEGRLRYIEWSRLTTRDQEVVGASEDNLLKAWKPDKSGVVREHKDAPRLEANVATDLMVHHALRRRGVCYAIAELMTFEVHEALINFLFDAYYKDAPEGYQRVTLTQLSMCDREIHLRLSDQCRAGFTLGSDGGLPLDRHLPVVLKMRCVEQLLIPRTRGSAAPAIKTAAKTKPNPRKRKNGDRSVPPPPQPVGGRSDIRPKKRTPYMPAALKGGVPVDASGAPLCWNYNLGKCEHGDVAQCPKGKHLCAVMEASSVAGFGVEAAVETSGSSVCPTPACDHFELCLDLCFPGITLQQHAAEIFARRVLIARPPTRQDVERLFDLLPLEEASRGTDVPSAFGSGCWARDHRFGLRRNNRLFPISVQLLNAFIRQVRPCHRWTSVVLFCDVQAPRHKDLRNSFDPNLVVAISDFSGGEIFVIRPDGPAVVHDGTAALRGIKLDPRVQPCLLHARAEEHLTLPWEGRRLVLVAFCIASVGELSVEQTTELEQLGFRVHIPPEPMPLPTATPGGQLCLEIFASPPGMSAAFRDLQLRTLALHHSPDRACSVPVMRWDVCKAEDVNFCLQRLKEKAVAFLFVMPPLSHATKPGPLSAALEQFIILLLATLTAYPTPFCFCLPASARCWKAVEAQVVGLPHHETPVDLCMFGAERKRRVIFLHNVPPLCRLQRQCDGQHTHLPWTAPGQPAPDAKRLPTECCRMIAQLSVDCVPGALMPPAMRPASVALQGFTKLSAVPPVVPEFKLVVRASAPADFEPPDQVPSVGCASLPGVPPGAVLLRSGKLDAMTAQGLRGDCSVPGNWSVSEGLDAPTEQSSPTKLAVTKPVAFGVSSDTKPPPETKPVAFGVPWTKDEFLQQAMKAEHPCNVLSGCESPALENINWVSGTPAVDVCAFRTNALKAILQSEAELRAEEETLHCSLHPEVAQVLKGKRLLLFRKLAVAAGVDDPSLFQEMCDGFRVLGYAKPSGQFPVAFKHASMAEAELKAAAPWVKGMLRAPDCRESDEVARALWDEAVEQASDDSGWLHGPLSEEDLDQLFPDGWIPSRRFGVQQGDKTRAIDDLRASMVNATCTSSEKILLQDIDVVAQTAKCFMDAVIRRKSPGNRQIVGRALDLKAAYKQLASSPLDAWASVLAVWDPTCNKHKYFRFSTLPFGAIHSVTSFNRVARALRLILLRIVKLIVTSFYDDFCQLETEALAESAKTTAELVLRILGWKIAEDPKKSLPFAKVFAMLGASFSLVRAPSGILEIANKEGRLESLRTLVNSVCAEGFVQPAVLASLKGRLLYASTHTFGRVALMAVKCLSRHLKGGGVLKLSSDDCVLLQHTIGLLEDMRPREIKTDASDRPVIVFTDGAHEEAEGITAHGGVLIDPVRGVHRFFGELIPKAFIDSWGAHGKRQLVGQAEVLPVLVAKIVWAEFLKGRKVLWFIDNDSAKAALGSGSSPVLATFAMLCVGAHIDVSLEAAHWYARVPSKANLADDASRLNFGFYGSEYTRTNVDWTCSALETLLRSCTAVTDASTLEL